MFRKNHGLSLVELMIVVVIIGILAALALPRFIKASKPSRQDMAQNTLIEISSLEGKYFKSNGRYWTGHCTPGCTPAFEGTLGVRFHRDDVYSYCVLDSAGVFIATAEGNLDGDPFLDRWRIDHTGNLVHISDDISDRIYTE